MFSDRKIAARCPDVPCGQVKPTILRLSRFYIKFCLQGDRSANYAERAADSRTSERYFVGLGFVTAAHALLCRRISSPIIPRISLCPAPARTDRQRSSLPSRNNPQASRWPDLACGRVPSCNCRSRSAASRSSCSANAKRMRSVLPDPEVEIPAARLQSAAFLRSSRTSATISFSVLGRGVQSGGKSP